MTLESEVSTGAAVLERVLRLDFFPGTSRDLAVTVRLPVVEAWIERFKSSVSCARIERLCVGAIAESALVDVGGATDGASALELETFNESESCFRFADFDEPDDCGKSVFVMTL